MTALLAALLALLAPRAHGAETSALRRGDLDIRVQLSGTVVAEGVFRSSADFDSCARDLKTSTGVWRWNGEALATLVSKQVSAALDAGQDRDGYDPGEFVRKAYAPTSVYCRGDCFLLRFFVKSKECVRARSPIFEAARSLKLIGHVRPEDVPWMRDGAEFSFWPAADPKNRRRARIPHLIPDEKGPAAGAFFTLALSPDVYLAPGDWQGEMILPSGKKNALQAPTDALLRRDGRTYLPVRVSSETYLPMRASSSALTGPETAVITGIAVGSEVLMPDGRGTGAVRRAALDLRVKFSATVVPDDIFRLKSTIEGRVERVTASSDTWRGAGQNLALLAHKELAAMIDSKGSQTQELLEERWQRVFRPTPIRCPGECFVLKVYAKEKSWVEPQALLFEAAARLKMVARVRPEDVRWVKDGQALTFWSLKDPQKTYQGRVTRYLLDVQGEKADPGASFVLILSPERFFTPGTSLEGEIDIAAIRSALLVPTDALLVHNGEFYLPVRVSTGITTQSVTEIFAPTPDASAVLVLDDSQLQGVERHHQEIDLPAVDKRLRPAPVPPAPPKEPKPKPAPLQEPKPKPAPPQEPKPKPAPPQEPKPKPKPAPDDEKDSEAGRRQPASVDEKDYGDDPYGDL